MCKLTSTSKKDIAIKLVDLHINHDYVDFVKKLGNLSSIQDQTIKPQESFECVFKLDIGAMP